MLFQNDTKVDFLHGILEVLLEISVSWFGKESWQKKVGFPVSSALHFLRINSFKFRLKQTSRCRQQKLQIVPELFKLGNIHLEVCINIPQPFADASVRNRHQVQGGRL